MLAVLDCYQGNIAVSEIANVHIASRINGNSNQLEIKQVGIHDNNFQNYVCF